MKDSKEFINKIIHGGCVEVMAEMPDECVDLVVTSPPYDDLREYKGYIFNFLETAKQIARVMKEGAVCVWVVGDQTINGSESGTSFKHALYFKKLGLNLHDTMIYQKIGLPYPSTTRYYAEFEYMFIFSKGRPKTINLIVDRENSTADSVVPGLSMDNYKVRPFGVRGNVWKYHIGYGCTTKDTFAYEHPAMFPEKLAMDHIISWSDEKDVVLDPFSGGGTTCKMARHHNRRYIGIECDKDYCKIARRRIAQDPEPQNLFQDMMIQKVDTVAEGLKPQNLFED